MILKHPFYFVAVTFDPPDTTCAHVTPLLGFPPTAFPVASRPRTADVLFALSEDILPCAEAVAWPSTDRSSFCSLPRLPTRSSSGVGKYVARLLTCLYPKMTSLNFLKRFPCRGLVKKSPTISKVGQYLMVIFSDLIRSFIQKYLTFMCLDFCPADIFPLVSSLIALWLSCSKKFCSRRCPCASRNILTHIVFGR